MKRFVAFIPTEMETVVDTTAQTASAETSGPDRGAGPQVQGLLHHHGRHDGESGLPEPGLPSRVRENLATTIRGYQT